MPAALSLLPVCPHWPPQWVERRQSYLGDALAGQRGLIKPPTYCIRCRKCSKHWDGDKAPCALQAGAGDKPGVMPLLRATTWGGSGSLQIRALLGLYNPRHQLVFLCCTVASELCPHAEGDRRCIPQDHPSLTSCLLTLWGVGGDLLHFFPSLGNGYIEGKELENFFQELESARKGAGVVRASPDFAPSFPCSLLPKGSGSRQPRLLWEWQ